MPQSADQALVTDPTVLFAVLAGILGGLFLLSRQPRLARVFEILPPVVFAYFLPMIATTAGILPTDSLTYVWMRRYLLPLALFLLMITVDLRAILRLGRTALLMMLAGTVGIVLGGPIALFLFKDLLPPDAWMGFAALSGSWIGGTANMLAVAGSVAEWEGVAWSIPGPVIVMDTVVGYGWMGTLLFLSTFQGKFDRWIKADRTSIEETNRRLGELDSARRPLQIDDLAIILGLGFSAALFCVWLGDWLPPVMMPAMQFGSFTIPSTNVISATTWTVLIVVTGGLVLSFTPLRRLEGPGASRIGYVALYLLLTSIGAQADLATILDTPVYLLAGVVWIAVHIGILLLAAWWLRAPLFFVATGSMANVGGAVSAPIVAGVYYPTMAPIGLLMAVAGYIIGIYAAQVCAILLSLMA